MTNSTSSKLENLQERGLARGARLGAEYDRVEQALQKKNVESTIVVFGSARTREDGTDQEAKRYRAAVEFGKTASLKGGARCSDPSVALTNVITTGGGPGIMEAANRGAAEIGAPTIGFNIKLPHEQSPNPYLSPGLSFTFHYFAIRKMHLAVRAAALVIFPGGVGTLDEFFEILTLQHTQKMHLCPIILYEEEYWKSVFHLDVVIEQKLLSPDAEKLYDFAETPDEIWKKLLEKGLSIPSDATLCP